MLARVSLGWNGIRAGSTAAVERGLSEGARSGARGYTGVVSVLFVVGFREHRGLLEAPLLPLL